MKIFFNLFSLALITLLLSTSCTKDKAEIKTFDPKDLIKSQISNDHIIARYRYSSKGKIEEVESRYYYKKYMYDDEDKLVKEENSMNLDVLSSSTSSPTDNGLVTAENCILTNYRIFVYDGVDSLKEIEYFHKEDEHFTYKSKRSLIYNDGHIIRVNLHDKTGEIKQFFTYTYDDNGNVISEKYYTENIEPELISEITYSYDDKKNPFIIFNQLGVPGIYTNSNNIIEENFTLYVAVPGADSTTFKRNTYEYNLQGNPIKLMTEYDEFIYTY
ncbi:hypothetical protein ACE1ET_04620 [Saccharicrinis sp. FJH62]|uniref:hypothetical protein n=1 Tax=Saccharicrinis sp. FJH62 TaxID=3344657 RepID=UPI0035D42926